MGIVAKGAPVHGEFSSANASALSEPNSRFAVYPAGSTTAGTVGASDYVVVTDLVITAGAALTVQVYDGADNAVGAGELVAKVTFGAAGSVAVHFGVPHVCQVGTWPKVITGGAGQVDVVFNGTTTSVL